MKKVICNLLVAITLLFLAQAQASIEITSFSVNERDGTIDASIELKTTENPAPGPISPITVYYTTVDGTATTFDNDYIKATGKLSFENFDTPKVVQIDIVQDSEIEGLEDFFLEASFDPPVDSCATGAQQNIQTACATAQKTKSKGSSQVQADEGDGTIGIEDDDRTLDVQVLFPQGGLTEVYITLECNNGDVDPEPTGNLTATKMTSGGVASFEVIDYLDDNSCIAYQSDGAPAGFIETFTNCDPGVTPSAQTCDIINVPSVSSIAVPTLPVWGMILLFPLLMLGAFLGLRRKQL